jgi:Rrf2 family protein
MKLTKSADFAIRIIIYFAESGESSTMPELSEKLMIPYHNLTKLVQALSKQQILSTQKGKNGGVSLFASPEDISIKDIIEIIDGPTILSDCIKHENLCKLSGLCKLKTALGSLQGKINVLMDDVKISQLV